MFSKNLKLYRLKNNLSINQLGEIVGKTSKEIKSYEMGEVKPDIKTIKVLSEALGVKLSDLLAPRNKNLVFVHGKIHYNEDYDYG